MVYFLLSMSAGQLCHYYVTRGTQNVLCVRDVFGPHFVVGDVLTSACIAWSQGQGGYVQ